MGRPKTFQGSLDDLLMEIHAINAERMALRKRTALLDLNEARMVRELSSLLGSRASAPEQVTA